jgi:hypothetical protein
MKSLIKLLFLLVLFDVSISQAMADRVEMKGVGIYSYDGKFFSSSEPTDGEKAIAVAMAKASAWKNYVASLNQAKQQAISQHEKEVNDNVEKFIIEYVVIDQYKDNDSKTLRAAVRVAFNDEAVNQFVQKLTVGNGQQGARSSDSTFSFLFTSRKATSVTQFDARKTEVRQTESGTSVAADGAISSTTKDSSGGSTLRKEDAVTYSISSSQDLDSAMGEVITTAGIEPAAYDDVVASCNGVPVKKFQTEFVDSDDLTPATRAAVIKSMRACEVRYFAYGTIDAGVPGVDPVSGNKRVFVSVRSQLWDIKPALPRKVGSVGPIQYSGLGPDESVASRNALRTAARDIAKILVDQLNAKGIR